MEKDVNLRKSNIYSMLLGMVTLRFGVGAQVPMMPDMMAV
jgi:hypothetical protein